LRLHACSAAAFALVSGWRGGGPGEGLQSQVRRTDEFADASAVAAYSEPQARFRFLQQAPQPPVLVPQLVNLTHSAPPFTFVVFFVIAHASSFDTLMIAPGLSP